MPALKINGSLVPLDSQVAMLDTGTSYIRVPASDFDRLKTLFIEHYNPSCYLNDYNGLLECYCGVRGSIHDFPNIQFVLSSSSAEDSMNYYVLTPEDYITKIGLTCQFKLNRMSNSSTPKWVLGATFLRKYYSVYDLDNQSIGLVLSRNYDDKRASNSSW